MAIPASNRKLSSFQGLFGAFLSKLKGLYSHELFWIAVAALLLRIVLLPYFATYGDPYFWARGLIYFNNGYDPYAIHLSVYPPFIYLLNSPIFRIVSLLGFSGTYFSFVPGLNGSPATPVFLTFWKLPLLAFDFLTGFLLYSISKNLSANVNIPRLAFVLWIFNPLNLVITYMHGAWDIIVGFLTLLGVFLMYKEDYFAAGLCFGLGTLAKLAPVYLLVPFSLLILLRGIKGSGFFNIVKKNILSVTWLIVGFALPFLVCAPLVFSYAGLMTYLPFASAEGYLWNNLNQWFFVAHPVGFNFVNSYLDIIQKLPLMFVVVSGLLVLLLYKQDRLVRLSLDKLLLFGVFFGMLSYLFYPSIVQAQYLLWYLPLLWGLLVIFKKFGLPGALISVAGILYYFASQGLVTPLTPLAAYSSIFSVQQYLDSFYAFHSLPTLITGVSFQKDLAFVTGLLGFVGLVLIIFRGAKLLWQNTDY